MSIHTAYIGIGTNIEPRFERMNQALEALKALCTNFVVSAIYETAPFGYLDQDDFLNAVVELKTSLSAENLHRHLKDLEKTLGRNKRDRWHEREIDFDLLIFDEEIIATDTLTVPHPGIPLRPFVLVPLAEIAPSLLHPLLGRTMKSLLDDLTGVDESIHVYSSNQE